MEWSIGGLGASGGRVVPSMGHEEEKTSSSAERRMQKGHEATVGNRAFATALIDESFHRHFDYPTREVVQQSVCKRIMGTDVSCRSGRRIVHDYIQGCWEEIYIKIRSG